MFYETNGLDDSFWPEIWSKIWEYQEVWKGGDPLQSPSSPTRSKTSGSPQPSAPRVRRWTTPLTPLKLPTPPTDLDRPHRTRHSETTTHVVSSHRIPPRVPPQTAIFFPSSPKYKIDTDSGPINICFGNFESFPVNKRNFALYLDFLEFQIYKTQILILFTGVR